MIKVLAGGWYPVKNSSSLNCAVIHKSVYLLSDMKLTIFDVATIAKHLKDIQELTNLLSLADVNQDYIFQCKQEWEKSKDEVKFGFFAIDFLEDFMPFLNQGKIVDGLNQMNKQDVVERLYKYRCICCV